MNPGDPTARVLKGKNQRKWLLGDNILVTATRNQTILAMGSHDTSTDHGTLHRSLDAAHANLTAAGVTHRLRVNLADAAFASAATFATPTQGVCLIPVPRTGSRATPGQVPAGHERMATRMATPLAARVYRRRAAVIEPVFDHLTRHGGRRLHYRGPGRRAEVTLMAVTHNIAQMARHHQRAGTIPTTAPPHKTVTIRSGHYHPARALTESNKDP